MIDIHRQIDKRRSITAIVVWKVIHYYSRDILLYSRIKKEEEIEKETEKADSRCLK